MGKIIELKKVNKWFDKFQVLKDIDLDVAPQEKIVICGPSGSGKSTLIRCINRLEEHQEGNITVDGTELSESTKNIEKIRATADKEKTIILADAYRQAEETKGNGDATAAATYANAYSKDPEFYDFTRSLKAYQSTFESKSDILLINPDSDFFKYLDNSKASN